jgi:DNA-binding SARP family transcriptional activator
MTTAALITKLKKKLEKETDKNVLKSIEYLLREDTKEARLRRRMMEGAIRSEEDIANGRVMSGAEAKRRLKERLAERQKSRESIKSAKRA